MRLRLILSAIYPAKRRGLIPGHLSFPRHSLHVPGLVPKALVKGKGIHLPDTLVPPLALPVIVQMVNTNNVCFSAFYDTPGLIKNDAKEFKGKATMPSALP